MKRQNRLTSEQQSHEQQLGVQETRQESVREFASVDEMLRHDALHTPVPPAIAHRLEESIRQISPPSTASSWWRRLFRGRNP